MYRLELPPSLYMYQLQRKENGLTNNFCSKKAFSLSSCKPNICFYSIYGFFPLKMNLDRRLYICIYTTVSTTLNKLQVEIFFKIWR